MSEASLSPKRVVILGLGWGGTQLLAELVKAKGGSHQITVVSPHTFHEVAFRMTEVVGTGDPDVHSSALYNLVRLEGVNYVTAVVEELKDGSVKLGSGEDIGFDVCVICTGTSIPIFMPKPSTDVTVEVRKAEIASWWEKIKLAEKIVVGGGGAIGCEVAADIKLRNPDKDVSVVSGGGKVLTLMQPAYQKKGLEFLKQLKIPVVADTVNPTSVAENGSLALGSGKAVPCDLFIPALVAGPNSAFVQGASKDEKGYVLVDGTLKVKGYSSIVFAFGDVTGAGGAIKTGDTVGTVAKNVVQALAGKPLVEYVPSFPRGQTVGPMLVALGHSVKGGLGLGPYIPGCFCSHLCFICPCIGGCCALQAGPASASAKSSWQRGVGMTTDKGLSDAGNKALSLAEEMKR